VGVLLDSFGIFTARISSPPIRWGCRPMRSTPRGKDTTSALTPFGITRAESRARATLSSFRFRSRACGFRAIRNKPGEWRFNRTILRKNEYDYWPYVTQRVEGLTQQFAPVAGLDNVSPGRNIQFIPYGLLANDPLLNQPGGGPPGFVDKFEHRRASMRSLWPKIR